VIKALLFDITYLLLTCVTLLILCYKLNTEYWRESDNNVFIDLVIFTVCFFMLLSISSEHSEGGAEIGAERAEIAWAGAEWWAGIIESMSCERIFSRSHVLHRISGTSGEIKVTRNPSGQVRYWSITSLSITDDQRREPVHPPSLFIVRYFYYRKLHDTHFTGTGPRRKEGWVDLQ